MVWSLPQFPQVPLDRTYALLDDMQRRYQLGNHSPHAVHQHRGLVAFHLGDLGAAEYWYDQMRTARRDSLSDCAGCVPSSVVQHLVACGRYEEAVAAGAPYTNGGCTEQPHWMLSELLLAYLATGRLDAAVDAYRRAYQRMRNDPHHLDGIGLCLQFLARSGNERAGLPLIEHHLPWLATPASPYAAMEFTSAAALVLRRLVEAGGADTEVRHRSADGTRTQRSTVAELLADLSAQARGLAAAFDDRNGNGYQGARIEARMAAPPIVDALPLTVLAGRATSATGTRVHELVTSIGDLTAAGDLAGAARRRLEVAYALRDAAQWPDAVEAAEEAVRSLRRAGLAQERVDASYLLYRLHRRADHHHAADAAAAVDEILAGDLLPTGVASRAALYEDSAGMLWGRPAYDRLVAAAEAYRGDGDAAGELRTLADALGRHPRSADTEDADLDATVDRVAQLAGAEEPPAGATAEELSDAWVAIAGVRWLQRRRDEARALLRAHNIDLYELADLLGEDVDDQDSDDQDDDDQDDDEQDDEDSDDPDDAADGRP